MLLRFVYEHVSFCGVLIFWPIVSHCLATWVLLWAYGHMLLDASSSGCSLPIRNKLGHNIVLAVNVVMISQFLHHGHSLLCLVCILQWLCKLSVFPDFQSFAFHTVVVAASPCQSNVLHVKEIEEIILYTVCD